MLLETNRLVLRKFTASDFNDYCSYIMNDDELAYMMKTEPIHTHEDAQNCFNWKLNRETEVWYAICLKEEKEKVIGGITMHHVPQEFIRLQPELQNKNGVSLSFSISRYYRRRGLMEEAVRTLIDYLFREEKKDFINCGYMDYNHASRQMQEKLGFDYLLTDRFEEDGNEFVAIENILWNHKQ